MSSNSPGRAKEVFAEAAELMASDRNAYLDSACSGDTELRSEVERLLAELDSNDDLLGRTSIGQLLFGETSDLYTFNPGELVGDRFRIVCLIGSGGMGEVYEAEDLRLGGRVAVKTLRWRYLKQPQFAARFRREIQLARRVTHRNVCRIFDVGRDGVNDKEVIYLTMELLKGETLADRLKRSSLPLVEAISIARQIAEGLAALHGAEIIHRDLKPSNVFLVGEGNSQRAVITDFGLAHEIESSAGEETLSTPGQILGTPAYAAPEQLTGRKCGPQTDIYALGLVMYEMFCGRRPFEGATAFESAARKLTASVEPPSACAPIDQRWDTVILRCLEREPEARNTTAAELLELIDCLAQAGESSLDAAVLNPTSRFPKLLRIIRRPALLAVALAVAAAVPIHFTALGAPIRRRVCEQIPGSTVYCDLPEAKHIAVFPFVTHGGAEADRALATGWARYVRESFHRLAPHPDRMCVHLRGDRLSEGVRLVLEGESICSGKSVTLHVTIRENTAAVGSKPLVLRRFSVTSQLDSVEDLHLEPLRAIARALGLEYAPREWTAWVQAGPRYASSAVAHLTGLGYLANGKYDEAAREFNSAIDPTRDFAFAAAHVGLAETYRLQFNNTRDPAWELRAKRAYERALPLDRGLGFAGAERGLAELDFAARKTGQAIEYYSAALALWPYDHPLQKSLVAAYEAADKLPEAESVLRAAAKRAPQCWLPYNALGALMSRHARPREAERAFLELIRLAPDNGSAYHNLAFDYIKMGRYDDAIQMASKSLEVRPYPMTYATLSRAYLYRGCARDALVNAKKAVELDPEYPLLWGTLADVLEGSTAGGAETRNAARRCIGLSLRALERSPGDAITRASYALNLARVGDGAQAIHEARKAVEQSPSNQHVLAAAADALERAGQRNEALTIVERALRGGLAVPEIQASRGLSPLRKDPRYRSILAGLKLDPAADPGELTPKQAGGCPAWDIAGKGLNRN